MLIFTLLIVSLIAGSLGSLLGLGGGIIVIPVLTLYFGVEIRYAVAASLISIIATSCTAASRFLEGQLTNIRIASLLELGTVFGAMTGFFIASEINTKWIFILFGGFLIFSSLSMIRTPSENEGATEHDWSIKLGLSGFYSNEKKEILPYTVAQVPLGLTLMYFAGVLSAILGIGSGIFKVMAMDRAMKLPIKVSTATSNFMIGVTASASAGAYFLKGDVRPEITAPVTLGIIAGSFIGAKILERISVISLRRIFVFVLLVVGFQMIIKGIKV